MTENPIFQIKLSDVTYYVGLLNAAFDVDIKERFSSVDFARAAATLYRDMARQGTLLDFKHGVRAARPESMNAAIYDRTYLLVLVQTTPDKDDADARMLDALSSKIEAWLKNRDTRAKLN